MVDKLFFQQMFFQIRAIGINSVVCSGNSINILMNFLMLGADIVGVIRQKELEKLLFNKYLFILFEQAYNLVTPVERTMCPCVGNEYFSRRAIYKKMCRNPFHSVLVAYIAANNNILPL